MMDLELSMEGQIRMDVVQSAEEMANVLTNKSPIKFSAFGIQAQVDMSFDKKYSVRSNSVVALMQHEVRRSQSIVDINNLKLNQNARLLAKNDPIKFRTLYGTSFIAGYTDGCSFDVKIDR